MVTYGVQKSTKNGSRFDIIRVEILESGKVEYTYLKKDCPRYRAIDFLQKLTYSMTRSIKYGYDDNALKEDMWDGNSTGNNNSDGDNLPVSEPEVVPDNAKTKRPGR